MLKCTHGIVALILLVVCAATGWSQQLYRYEPKAVAAGENSQIGPGVLVQEVQIQKGDTLSRFSRKYSGRGSYYPQILLFNDIKNPNKIYAGDTIKLPVSPGYGPLRKQKIAGSAAVTTETGPVTQHDQPASITSAPEAVNTPVAGLKKTDITRKTKQSSITKITVPVKQAKADKKTAPTTNTGQKLFDRAVTAYRQDNCRTALELFDRFLAENPASPLAADVNLYKAECYLKLSSQ